MLLVPIRVKVKRGRRPDGTMGHIFPEFNQIDPSLRGNMDWSNYIDHYGIGWHYDKKCGFNETDSYNTDPEVWYGVTAVPESFADAAVQNFPNLVEYLNETTFAAFYDNRAHDHESDEIVDIDVLNAIIARMQLENAGIASPPTQAELTKRREALDPKNSRPGIRENPAKTWAKFKAKRGITLKNKVN